MKKYLTLATLLAIMLGMMACGAFDVSRLNRRDEAKTRQKELEVDNQMIDLGNRRADSMIVPFVKTVF